MNKKIILSISLAGFLSLANAQTEKQIPEVTIASKSSQEINKSGKNVTLLTQKTLKNTKARLCPMFWSGLQVSKSQEVSIIIPSLKHCV